MARFAINQTQVTREPRVVVDAGLRPGLHRFRLVVTDDAGQVSRPDEVVVQISALTPVGGFVPVRRVAAPPPTRLAAVPAATPAATPTAALPAAPAGPPAARAPPSSAPPAAARAASPAADRAAPPAAPPARSRAAAGALSPPPKPFRSRPR